MGWSMMNKKISFQTTLLDFLQQHLRQIRSICNWSGSEMAEILGVSRQTVSNIETCKTKLQPSLYLAIGAMLEKRCRQSPILKEYLDVCFTRFPSSLSNPGDGPVTADTLTEHWFSTFLKQFSKTVTVYEPSGILLSNDLMLSICRNCKILLCHGILLHEHRLACVEELCKMARQQGNSPILPYRSFREMEAQLSHDCAQRIQRLVDTKLLLVYGRNDDPPLNMLAVKLFFSLSKKYRLAFITDDGNFANDLQLLNSLKTVGGYPACALTITDDGLLQSYFPTEGATPDNRRQDESGPAQGNFNSVRQKENSPAEGGDFSGTMILNEEAPIDFASAVLDEAKAEVNVDFLCTSACEDWETL